MTPEQKKRHHLNTLRDRLAYLRTKALQSGKPAKQISFILAEAAALEWALAELPGDKNEVQPAT